MPTDPETRLRAFATAHRDLFDRTLVELADEVLAVADLLAAAIADGGRILLCGNGGSAADAQHFAAELIGCFGRQGGRPVPAIALTVDSSVVTALANDRGYAEVFSHQIEALGRPGDVVVAISTSGRSANVLEGLERSRAVGLASVLLTGSAGAGVGADHVLAVPSGDTQRIQEMHAFLLHAIGEIVLDALGEAP